MSIKWLIDNYTSYIRSSEGVVLESECVSGANIPPRLVPIVQCILSLC